jgi:hypothetical protein
MIVPLLLAADFMNFTYNPNPCAGNVKVPILMPHESCSWTYSTPPATCR